MQHRLSSLTQIGFWGIIVVLAFIMQVAPFLLIMTMINIAFGVSSATALVVIPTAMIAMLVTACVIAERKRREWAPSRERRTDDASNARKFAICVLPYVKQ